MRILCGFFVECILAAALLYAQPGAWQKVSVPLGGPVSKLYDAGGAVVAAVISNSYSEHWYCLDDTVWRRMEAAEPLNLAQVKGNSEFLFGRGRYGVLYRSSDRGQSWNILGPFDQFYSVDGWSVEHHNVLVVDSHWRLWLSTNDGDSWDTIPMPNVVPYYQNRRVAALHNGWIFLSTSSNPEYELARSTDLGRTWAIVFRDPDLQPQELLAEDSVVLVRTSYALFRSVNWGWRFDYCYPSAGADVFKVALRGGNMYVASGTRDSSIVVRSVDGHKWDTTIVFGSDCSGLVASAGRIFSSVGDGVYLLNDTGKTWTMLMNGISENIIRAMCGSGSGSIFSWVPGGLYRSGDGGHTWVPAEDSAAVPVNPVSGSLSVLQMFSRGDTIRLVTGTELYESGDNGGHIRRAGVFPEDGTVRVVKGALFLQGSSGGIYRSAEAGAVWNRIEGFPGDRFTGVTVQPLSAETVLVAAVHRYDIDSTGLYLSRNGGATWELTGWTERPVDKLVVYDEKTLLAWSKRTIFLSTDLGATWELRSTRDTTEGTTYMILNGSIVASALQYSNSNWISSDTGRSFSLRMGLFPEGVFVGNMYRIGGEIFAGGDRLWKITASDLLAVREEPRVEVPALLHVDPCYPNPFNPVTNISYTLSRHGFVSIKVFDLLGRQVDIVLESLQQAGEHVARWNAGTRSSGVYVVVVCIAGETHFEKVTLLK